KSIFDLMAIHFTDSTTNQDRFLFQRIQQDLATLNDPGFADGDFSGIVQAIEDTPSLPDGTRNDFEEQYQILTKVSNLLTTRSGTVTVYIVLEGWRGSGTKATKVVERRKAMIIDRTGFTQDHNQPPTNRTWRWDLDND